MPEALHRPYIEMGSPSVNEVEVQKTMPAADGPLCVLEGDVESSTPFLGKKGEKSSAHFVTVVRHTLDGK